MGFVTNWFWEGAGGRLLANVRSSLDSKENDAM